ncbi:MAG: cation:proton antiporter [Gammaproteobacteria bacterium]|nr:cation:proton antiporter [Gammaproteobacteria bacterium]
MPVSETILISMGLLTIAIVAAGLLRNMSIPYTVLLVLIGIGLSELAKIWTPLQGLHHFQLTPDLVFFVFLPALIFESGLSLDSRQLLKDLAPILSLAIPALLISTTLVGLSLWLLLDIDLTIALLFGALISATDPVAVVALFKELGAPLRLNVLVEGESLFNDATAIVVFTILLGMVVEGSQINVLTSLGAIAEFFRVFIGGALVGVVIGLLVSELLYRLQSHNSAILTMSIVSAYSSFIIAEHGLHVSGVMATVTSAMALGIYGLTRLSNEVKPVLAETWELIGLVANSLLFLLVGLSINSEQLLADIDLILIVVLIVLLARAASVYSLLPTTTRLFRLPRVSMAERHIMWWGGLKGGLAIAIVLSIPETVPGRDLLINLTLGVVLFSLMVNAWSIRPLMHRLKLDRLSQDEQAELEQGLHHALNASSAMLERFRDLGVISDKLNQHLSGENEQTFSGKAPVLGGEQTWRKVYLSALRMESDTLDHLYQTGLITQYTLLDRRHSLQMDREAYSQQHLMDMMQHDMAVSNLFKTMEMWILRKLREKNWAAGILSNYQRRRLSHHIQRNIAGMAMSQSVVEMLGESDAEDSAVVSAIMHLYQHRFDRWQQRLQALHRDFQEYFETIEEELFARASMVAAQLHVEQEFHHGQIGIKAYNRISKLIQQVLKQRNQVIDVARFYAESIAQVPLFAGLSDEVLRQLSQHAYSVTFLPDDVIIGEGDHGDALYIITHGEAEVTKQTESGACHLGDLKEGDFFGEMALLGDQVRTATVAAVSAMTLIRITRQDVVKVARLYHEVQQRLERARDERIEAGRKQVH